MGRSESIFIVVHFIKYGNRVCLFEDQRVMTMEGMMDEGILDDIIKRLLEWKGGKQVKLSEGEIRQLCVILLRFMLQLEYKVSSPFLSLILLLIDY